MRKNKKYYLSLSYQMIVRKDEFGDFVANYKEYPLITGCGDTEAEAIKELKSAFSSLIDELLANGEKIKEPSVQKKRINAFIKTSTLKKIDSVSNNRSLFLDSCAEYVISHNIKLPTLGSE